jgi:hypothetical protein
MARMRASATVSAYPLGSESRVDWTIGRVGMSRRRHHGGMSIWVTLVLLPIGVSVATAVLIGLTVGPRLAARGKRIQAAHDSRDRFGDSVLDILALCSDLEKVHVRSDITDPLRSRLQGERDRWLSQIDERTIWLVDHWRRFVLGYSKRMDVRNLVARYVADARGLWLSDRPLEERVRMLRELTEHIQTIYFARRWRASTAMPQEIIRLRTKLDILEGNTSPTSLASDP